MSCYGFPILWVLNKGQIFLIRAIYPLNLFHLLGGLIIKNPMLMASLGYKPNILEELCDVHQLVHRTHKRKCPSMVLSFNRRYSFLVRVGLKTRSHCTTGFIASWILTWMWSQHEGGMKKKHKLQVLAESGTWERLHPKRFILHELARAVNNNDGLQLYM